MKTMEGAGPHFNLWTDPWITVEKSDGSLEQLGIADALEHAHEKRALYDPSPLVVVGVHRLLTAILQDAMRPKRNADLDELWRAGRFPSDKLQKFGKQWRERFELLDGDRPFMQSSDVPLFPENEGARERERSAAVLFPEMATGTFTAHYRHRFESEQAFAPATLAAGLVTLPCFASSGGAGIMPSLNGAPPPIYVLPGGRTLFESLAASLIAERNLEDLFLPPDEDRPWWRRERGVVASSKKGATGSERQLAKVGYLQGLTFPPRKVRLYPERLNGACTRSGQASEWLVRRMFFKMGESLQKEKWWRDPFVGYRVIKDKPNPRPIFPARGKLAWREFSGLFLQAGRDPQKAPRPLFLDQFAALAVAREMRTYPFRVIGLQAKADAKVFEWFDYGLDVPPALLQDPNGAAWAERALALAENAARVIQNVFVARFGQKVPGATTGKSERFRRLKDRMLVGYWEEMAGKFQSFLLELEESELQARQFDEWTEQLVRTARAAFERAADETGDTGRALHRIEQAKSEAAIKLAELRTQGGQNGSERAGGAVSRQARTPERRRTGAA